MEKNDFNKNLGDTNTNELFIQIPTDNDNLGDSKIQDDSEYDIIDDSIFTMKENSSNKEGFNQNLDFSIIHIDIKDNSNYLNENSAESSSQSSKNNIYDHSNIEEKIDLLEHEDKKIDCNVSTFLVDNSSTICEKKHEILDNQKLLMTLSDLEKSKNKLTTKDSHEKLEMQNIDNSSYKSNRIFGNFDDTRNSLSSFLNNWWKPNFDNIDNKSSNNQHSHETEIKKKMNIDFSIFQRETERNQENTICSNEIINSPISLQCLEKG